MNPLVFRCLLSAFFIMASPGLVLAGDALLVREATKLTVLRGYTRAARSIELTSEVSGKVKSVNYEVGQAVGEAPFIEIDTTFIDLSMESTNKQVERLRVAQKRAASRVKYLEKEFGRLSRLYKEGRASEAKSDASEQQLTEAMLEQTSILAELGAARVGLRELKERRQRHSLRPPEGWLITGRLVEPGEVVGPGRPLGKASDFSGLVVPISVSMAELEALASISNSIGATLEGRPVRVRLNWQNPDFDERTRKSSVEIALMDTAGLEPRGGLALELPLMVRAEGLLVPRAAVSWRYANPRVRLSPGGEVVSLIVVDESGEDLVVADDGSLKPGDLLLGAGPAAGR